MTDVIASPEGRIFAELSAFVRTPFGAQCARVGLAALGSGVGALAICAVLWPPASAPSAVQQTAQVSTAQLSTAQMSVAAKRVDPDRAGFDVGRAWAEEHALLHAATHPELRTARADTWPTVGGVPSLLASRLPSATPVAAAAPSDAHLTTAEAKAGTGVPLPIVPPASRRGDVARTATGGQAQQSESRVASLPPQTSEPGYFNFFRRLFQAPDHDVKVMLAANPQTAIYDIAQRAVYLPNGDKLEAHSGYGKWKDDPSSVDRKNLGVTPPNVYAVSFREKLFHGVRALRLTPVGDGKMYGRDGMLAHSYMLGENGQSNGCVSVKNYRKFLQAYEDGVFKKLIVVRSADDVVAPAQIASVQPGRV